MIQRLRFRLTFIRPTRAALRGTLGDAPVRIRVSRELRRTLMKRLAKPMSPAEAAARRWYGEHVEPVVRWLPDRAQRGAWRVQRVTRPMTSRLARPWPRGPRILLKTGVPYLTPDQRAYVEAVVAAKMPAGSMAKPQWNMIGKHARGTWRLQRRPPAKCGYADLTARWQALREWEFFLGLGVDGPTIVSLHDDSPHVALSAGTGAGKSVLAMLVAVQVLARGGWVVILDRKGSHRWALGVPGVDYCTQPEQMHAALLRLAKLADERNAAALYEAEDWDPGPRVLVIAEELNATMAQIRAWWDDVREKGQPKIPPAVRAFRELIYMGRSAKVNVLAVAQMLSANTTGGPETRENFGIRCLARYTVNAWKMLVPEAAMPRSSRTLGRWQVVRAGVATETQVCFLRPVEARLFVAKASPTSPVPGEFSRSEPIKGDPRGSGNAGNTEPAEQLVTLRQVVERGLFANYEVAKKRLQKARRSEPSPAPAVVGKAGNADLFRLAEMLAWIESELTNV